MNWIQTARCLLNLYTSNRAVGHTDQLLVGANNFRGDSILIGATTHHARDLGVDRSTVRDMFKTHTAGIRSLERTAGLRGAIAIDNGAMMDLLSGLVAEHTRERTRAEVAERNYETLMAHDQSLISALRYERDTMQGARERADERARAAEAKVAGLKEGMRDLGKGCKMDPVLVEAMIMGCADEGSVNGRIR